MVIVAQLVRASDCGSEGRGFETRLSPRNAKLRGNSELFLFDYKYGNYFFDSKDFFCTFKCQILIRKIMGSFVISKRKNGEFQFVLKAGNGQVILASEGYTTKAACENGIESVRKNSQVDARFDRLEAKNGKPYFNLKATNGQIIGNSEMYESVAARDNGIASVAKNAPDATVKEELE